MKAPLTNRLLELAITLATLTSTAMACAPLPLSVFSAYAEPPAPPKPIVHIIAPSGKGSATRGWSAAQEVSLVRSYVISQGLIPILHDDVFSPPEVEPIYANTDLYRASDLVDALTDNSSVIWCIRGGKGAARLVPYLDARLEHFHQFKAHPTPKLFIGFSDITVLHAYLIQRPEWNLKGPTVHVHGGMLSQIVNGELDEESVSSIWDIILHRKEELHYKIKCLNEVCKSTSKNGTIDSTIVGGTLTLLQTSIGTSWQVQTSGKLMLLEDTHEPPYKIERMLDHLKQAGLFKGVTGVLIADVLESRDGTLLEFVLQRFADSLAPAGTPVYRIRGVGHARKNTPVPLNTRARIEIETFEDGQRGDLELVVEVPKFGI